MSAHQGPGFVSFWCDVILYGVTIWRLSLDILYSVCVCVIACVCLLSVSPCESTLYLSSSIRSFNLLLSETKHSCPQSHIQEQTVLKPPLALSKWWQYSEAPALTICRMLLLCHLIPLAGANSTVSHVLNPLEPVGLLNTVFV